MIVISVARVEPSKRPYDFIKVARNVKARLGDVEFIWVGEGTLRRKIVENLSREESAYIRFVGYRSEYEKDKLLRNADVYVSTSESEGFALTLGEAFLRNLPVVVYNLPVYTEVYDDFPLRVKLFDIEDFTEKVLVALDKPQWLIDKVALAREYVLTRYSYRGIGMRATGAILEILDPPSTSMNN
jgi:glycosyltransferase involved in cell wall biosynthesis